MSTVKVALTGAVIGAGAVVAGAVALNNKNNQDKIRGAIDDAKEVANDIKKKAGEVIDEVEKKIEEGKVQAEEMMKPEEKIVSSKTDVKIDHAKQV